MMSKTEIKQIKNVYKNMYERYALRKDDNYFNAQLDMYYLMVDLKLQKEVCDARNEVIISYKKYNEDIINTFKMITDDFKKYGEHLSYELDKIKYCFEDLMFKMTDEEIKANTKRIQCLEKAIEK